MKCYICKKEVNMQEFGQGNIIIKKKNHYFCSQKCRIKICDKFKLKDKSIRGE